MLYSGNFSLGEVFAVNLAKDAVTFWFTLKLSMTMVLMFFSNHLHIIGLYAFA